MDIVEVRICADALYFQPFSTLVLDYKLGRKRKNVQNTCTSVHCMLGGLLWHGPGIISIRVCTMESCAVAESGLTASANINVEQGCHTYTQKRWLPYNTSSYNTSLTLQKFHDQMPTLDPFCMQIQKKKHLGTCQPLYC